MSDFEDLLEVQAALDNRFVEVASENADLDPAFFCFARHHMLDKARFGYDITISKNWMVVLFGLALLPVDLFRVLVLAKRRKNLIISTDRYSASGRQIHLNTYPTRDQSIEFVIV